MIFYQKYSTSPKGSSIFCWVSVLELLSTSCLYIGAIFSLVCFFPCFLFTFGHCFFCHFFLVSSKPWVPHSCLSCIFSSSSSSSSSFHSHRHENNYCSHRKYLDVVGCRVLCILVDLSLHLSNDLNLLM